MTKKKVNVELEIENIWIQSISANDISNSSEDYEEKFQNKVEIIKFDKELKSVVLKNVSEITVKDTFSFTLEVRGKIKVESDIEDDFEGMINEIKEAIARPLYAHSSSVIGFITEKITSIPVITPPQIWEFDKVED